MVDPVAALGFSRLRALLQGEMTPARAKQARRAAMSQDIERSALSNGFPARMRLAALVTLSQEASRSELPQRDRTDIAAELDRLALRILWHEGLLADSCHRPRPPYAIAEKLLEFAAGGLLPEGPVGRMVLDRARVLLRHHDSIVALQAQRQLRERLMALLIAAQQTIKNDRPTERAIPLTAPS